MSVVVTVLNERRSLGHLLPALSAQLGPEDELLVVDGGSNDGTTDVVRYAAREDPRIRLLVVPGAGISRGRNEGVTAAHNEIVACTDAGCTPSPGWLEAFRSAIEDAPEAGLWTGVYEVSRRTVVESAMAAAGYPEPAELAHPTWLSRAYTRVLGQAFDATMPTGRSMAFRTDVWKRVGGFREDLATGEDVTFGRAVAAEHRPVLVRDAVVAWTQRTRLRETVTMYFRYGQGSGHSGDTRLLARDAARLVAYGTAAGLLANRGKRSRRLALAGDALYLSLPLARAMRQRDPLATTVLVPPMAAVRDLAKSIGAVVGYVQGRRR